MTQMTHADILKRAFDLYTQRDNIAYFMGAKVQVLTDELMDQLRKDYWDAHFKRYTDAEFQKIKDWSRGKLGMDCSGFVGYCVNDKWLYSGALWERCVNKTTVKDCKAGSILYRVGHVGLDIGYGYQIDCPIEMQTLRITKNSVPGFTGGGEWKYADYSKSSNI